MVGYKADGTPIYPRPKDPNAKQAVKAGDVPRTPLTPADLDAVHQHSVESAALKRKVTYLTSLHFAVAVLARLDALEAKVAALEATGATG